MLRTAPASLLTLLAALTAFTLGCSDDGGGDGGGGVQIQPTIDGEFVGFLWKPRSESNGNLVVLLPTQLRGQVATASLHTTDSASQDTLVEIGRFAGDTHNGNRPHFRFNESGSHYGEVWVVATLSDGSNLGWHVPNGASRLD
jgi:hypothetical protein